METKRLGFLLLNSAPITNHFIRLLEALNRFKESSIVIHHDVEQAGEFPEEIRQRFNLIILKHSYKTYWSHVNNVYATIDGLEELYKQTLTIDWFITLTPSCYPIKAIEHIEAFYNQCDKDALIDMHVIGGSKEFEQLDVYLKRDFKEQPWFNIPFISSRGKFYILPKFLYSDVVYVFPNVAFNL